MAEPFSAQELPSTLDRLVEAWHDRARARLAFRNLLPRPASAMSQSSSPTTSERSATRRGWPTYKSRWRARACTTLRSPGWWNNSCHRTALFVMPYQGKRDEFKDKEFVILNTGTEVTVEPYVPGVAYF